jgi:hypothetical protein
MLRTRSDFESSASAISASTGLIGFEARLTRIKKNPGLAERSNAEKWVPYLSAFDFSAHTIGIDGFKPSPWTIGSN